ncbi:unnamed protein product [Protopolystoma xenopodis]|uniref:Uncharacterized protein n=1 Tax=Protopolystoma xenopodis TaxID=117903 RepID=A0A3S5BP13_9PLAT|nr:unnamed protein product [Protopolystoma xenopodis]
MSLIHRHVRPLDADGRGNMSPPRTQTLVRLSGCRGQHGYPMWREVGVKPARSLGASIQCGTSATVDETLAKAQVSRLATDGSHVDEGNCRRKIGQPIGLDCDDMTPTWPTTQVCLNPRELRFPTCRQSNPAPISWPKASPRIPLQPVGESTCKKMCHHLTRVFRLDPRGR